MYNGKQKKNKHLASKPLGGALNTSQKPPLHASNTPFCRLSL